MSPVGKLIIIGGGIDKGSYTDGRFDPSNPKNHNFLERGILRRIIDESKHKEASLITVVTTASQIPLEVGDEYKHAFELLGATNVEILHIGKREIALKESTYNSIKISDVVMFTGGDQLRLTSILGGTPLHDLILRKYETEEFIYAGTSAGAAAASQSMIYQGSSTEALLKGEIKITSGLGLIDDVVVDTHFVQRGRMGRLFQAVVGNPKTLGIGLGEDTGLYIREGKIMQAIGSGTVILVDGRNIADTNLTQVELGTPISIKNLVVHAMSDMDEYDMEHHSFEIHQHPITNLEE